MSAGGEAIVTTLAEVARKTWECRVAADGRRAEWCPVVVLYDDAGRGTISPIVGQSENGVEWNTGGLVMTAASMMVDTNTAWLCVTVDAYVALNPKIARRVTDGETTLSQLYRNGVHGVVDCLVAHAVDRQGESASRELPYRVRGRSVHWLDPLPIPVGATRGGRLVDGSGRS